MQRVKSAMFSVSVLARKVNTKNNKRCLENQQGLVLLLGQVLVSACIAQA